MLCDLERQDEVETPPSREGGGEVPREESLTRNLEGALVDVLPVDAVHVVDPELAEDGEPRSRPAADVDDAPRPRELENEWRNDFGRPPRLLALSDEEVGGVVIVPPWMSSDRIS